MLFPHGLAHAIAAFRAMSRWGLERLGSHSKNQLTADERR